MESINLLRLKSGEDIICFMEHYGHDELAIRDAMVVFTKTDFKSGKQIIMLEHWLPIQLIQENVTVIKQSEVIASMVPNTAFTDYYVTGGTYSAGTITLNRQNGSVTVTAIF